MFSWSQAFPQGWESHSAPCSLHSTQQGSAGRDQLGRCAISLWLKVCRVHLKGVGISQPLLVVSTTSNYLELGPNANKSPRGMNISVLTWCPAQVTATLHQLQHTLLSTALQAKMLPTNTNKKVKIHFLHLALYSSLKYMTKLCSDMSGKAIQLLFVYWNGH